MIHAPTQHTQKQDRFYLAGLDGLRAIAVTMVLLFHFFPDFMHGGFLGVDVFFVISGFLITTLLLREHAKTGIINLRQFWARRVRRLLPALVIVLLLCSSLTFLVNSDSRVGLPYEIISSLLFCSNWVMIGVGTDYFQQSTPELFRNTWSLSVEEQFYLMLPIALLLLVRMHRLSTRLWIVIIAGFISILLMLTYSGTASATRVYFGTDSHLFGLLFGVALALYMYKRNATLQPAPTIKTQALWLSGAFVGLIILFLLGLNIKEGSPASFQFGFVGAVFAALVLIYCITQQGSLAGKLMDNPVMRWIGVRSYGIYLWHWPLMVLANYAFRGASHEFIAVFVLICTLLLAALSHRFLENPVRKHGIFASLKRVFFVNGLSSKSRVALLTTMAIVTLSLPLATAAVLTAPEKSSAQIAIEESQRQLAELQRKQAEIAAKQAAEQQAREAQEAKEAAVSPAVIGPKITAIGDSVMLASAVPLTERFPGIHIDAAVSRGMSAGVNIGLTNGVRDIVIIGLATNGTIDTADLDRLRQSHPNLKMVLVNAYGDRSWIPEGNKKLQDYANAHPGDVIVADWQAAAAAHTDMLAGDGIHPNPQSGGVVYTDTIAEALKKLLTR